MLSPSWPLFYLDLTAWQGMVSGRREMFAALDACRASWGEDRARTVERLLRDVTLRPGKAGEVPVAAFHTPTGREVALVEWARRAGLDLVATFAGWRPFVLSGLAWSGTVESRVTWVGVVSGMAAAWSVSVPEAKLRLGACVRGGGTPGVPAFGPGEEGETLDGWASAEGMSLQVP